jgi:four helix bundle protein
MKSIVKERSYEFALWIISLARWLRERKEYELASQALRSGTSIGANVEEALAGVSRADFVAKMAIASKEARETHYWLRLLRDSKTVPDDRIVLLDEAEQLVRIMTAIVKTSQSNSNLKPQNLKLKTQTREGNA